MTVIGLDSAIGKLTESIGASPFRFEVTRGIDGILLFNGEVSIPTAPGSVARAGQVTPQALASQLITGVALAKDNAANARMKEETEKLLSR